MYEIDMLEGALRSRDKRIAELERERDAIRECLLEVVECWDGPLYRHEMLPLITKARAALKECE